MKRVLLLVALFAGAAHADPWYAGKYGHNRVLHLSITLAGGAVYASSETFLKPSLASSTCSWCAVDSVDADVRNAVVWSNPKAAVTLSNLDGYLVAPVFALGMTVAGSLTSDDPSWARVIDDTGPVLETAALSELVDQTFKFVVARQRPYAHYRPPGAAASGLDDNVSFFSGHSVLVFGLATSAGVIAHKRHSWTEPYIWIGGGAIALTTAYLRMAGDEHYLTDIVAGTAVGIGFGLFVPTLWDRTVEVMPTGNGVAVAGSF